MSSDDDDRASDGKPKEREIPPTRRHESVVEPAATLPPRMFPVGVVLGLVFALVGIGVAVVTLRDEFPSAWLVFAIFMLGAGLALLMMNLKGVPAREEPVTDLDAPATYPDDDGVSKAVRSVDAMLGKAEQVVLVSLLFTVMMVAVISTLADKLADAHPFGHFKDDAIRGGTFAMALIGAAFAMHQGRHLSMDLLSRRLAPRARLLLKVVLAVFTIGIVILMIRSGFHTIDKEAEFKTDDKLITPLRLAYLVPIGGVLIIVHTVLHTIIDVSYLARRKTPPEKMRTGH